MPDAVGKLGYIEGQMRLEVTEGIWHFSDDEWALLAMLADPIYCAELLFGDPNNRAYGGCYHVMDYQYVLFRQESNKEMDPCARSVGKTESLKADAVSHPFRRRGEDMLITAPELIHLLPLTDAIEARIMETRLTREMLDTRGQKTGITHKPFQVDFLGGTKIIGRIPKITGTGVKGQHVPDLRIDEGQDYPTKGWVEVFPTVMTDHTDRQGRPDYTIRAFGVHTGARDTQFYNMSVKGEFKVTQVTAIMRPGWGPEEKSHWAAVYGGTQSPDYRRNILGEAGGASSAFFVTARLMACMDQDRESKYNTEEYRRVDFRAEEIDQMLGEVQGHERWEQMFELLRSLLDLPDMAAQQIYCGADIGSVNDPTVIVLFTVEKDTQKRMRLKLRRMIHLWRFREKQIRMVYYLIALKYGQKLRGWGSDATGMGLPIFQAIEDDEVAPQHLLDVHRGYVFNAKVPVGVDPTLVSKDSQGNVRDAYGNIVEIVRDPFTGDVRYIVKMSMIEASTRYLRKYVDSGFFMIPFEPEIASDMQGETEQRVRAMAGYKGKKPNAFHILDAMRAFAMVYEAAEVESQLAVEEAPPVLARAVDTSVTVLAQ